MTGLAWTASDWTALGSVLSGAGTVIGALAVIGTAWLGSRTFNSWRRQTLSQRRIDQAERILTATYRVRHGLSIVRNPMLGAGELSVAEDYLRDRGHLSSNDADKTKQVEAQVYYTRLNAETENRRELEGCQPMARALFDEPLELVFCA